MKKPYQKKQQGSSPFGTQTVFSNTFEAPFNANKLTKYYGIVKVGEKSFIAEYEAKFRSEAIAVLEEEARLSGGKLETLGVYK
jgi:hypothetical protein